MPNITEMNATEFRDLLHTLVNEELFKSRERLAALLAKDSPREALDAGFFHFHGDYGDFAYWLEDYEEDPLEGLVPDTPLTKKLKRQREYVLANRKTTLVERNFRRMGLYLNSDPMPEKKSLSCHWLNTAPYFATSSRKSSSRCVNDLSHCSSRILQIKS